MKTYVPRAGEIERRWYIVDAEGQTLGRLCSEVARVLLGKHKATFTPNLDTGDFVIVVNAAKIRGSPAQSSTKNSTTDTRGFPAGSSSDSNTEMSRRK